MPCKIKITNDNVEFGNIALDGWFRINESDIGVKLREPTSNCNAVLFDDEGSCCVANLSNTTPVIPLDRVTITIDQS